MQAASSASAITCMNMRARWHLIISLVMGLLSSYSISCCTASDTGAASSQPYNLRFTTPEQRKAFARDGYVVMRGLLDPSTVEELSAAGHVAHEEGILAQQQQQPARNTGNNNSKATKNVTALSTDYNGNVQTSRVALSERTSAFSKVALYSDIPAVVAELMQLDPTTQNLRLIHDFFFSRSILDTTICDWHVDGHGLWPESLETPSLATQAAASCGTNADNNENDSNNNEKDQDGINAWIAMDDMPVEFQGSMAVAAGSHRVPWRYDALRAIGRPGDAGNGGETWNETVTRIASGQGMVEHPEQGPRIRLCSLGVTDPDLYDKLEEQKHVLDLKRGDVVFCSRTLFHRTLHVTDTGREHYQRVLGRAHLHRYSIRYTLGSAVLPTGYSWLEWSMLMNPKIAGWTLDQAVSKEEYGTDAVPYWFPKVWPTKPDDLDERLNALAPHIEAAQQQSEIVRAKLFAEVAELKKVGAEESCDK